MDYAARQMKAMDSAPPAAPGEVYAQLDRITASSGFRNSPRLCRLLRYLVEHSLAGANSDLLEYTVGLEVFDRSAGFDPRSDTIVRVTAHRLRRCLANYYREAGRQESLQLQIPKGHYRVLFTPVSDTLTATVVPARPGKIPRLWLPGVALGAAAMLLVSIWILRPPGETGDAPILHRDQDAQRHLLLAQHLYSRRGEGDVVRALAEFERALTLDPLIADAWVGIAAANKILSLGDELPYSTSLVKRERALDKALALEPDHAEALARLSCVYEEMGREAQSLEYFQRALEFGRDDPMVLSMLAGRLRANGQLPQALELQRRAVQLEPLSALQHANLAEMLSASGQFDAALESINRAGKLSPNLPELTETTLFTAILAGYYREARGLLQELSEGAARYQAEAMLAFALESETDIDAPLARLGESQENRRLAEIHAFRGETDMAMGKLRRAHQQILEQELQPVHTNSRVAELYYSPFFRPLRDTPQWQDWSALALSDMRASTPPGELATRSY